MDTVHPLILIVDDVEATRGMLADVLRRRGYDVNEAADGEQGLAILRQHPSTCVVVLDLLMPNADGWWFRERQLADATVACVPVIVFSVSSQTDLVKYTLKTEHVLQKPISVDALLATIDDCCGGRGSASSNR